MNLATFSRILQPDQDHNINSTSDSSNNEQLMAAIESTMAPYEAQVDLVEGCENAAAVSHPSAVEQVLRTTELLESVLLELACRDLLLVQRVSKTWQATVVGSSALQRALCFAPCEQSGGEKSYTTYTTMKPQPDAPDRLSARDFLIEAADDGKDTPNPLLATLFRRYDSGEEGDLVFNWKVIDPNSTPRMPWLSMLISQPPTTRVRVQVTHEPALFHFMGGTESVEREIHSSRGITIMHVLNCIMRIEKEFVTRYINLHTPIQVA